MDIKFKFMTDISEFFELMDMFTVHYAETDNKSGDFPFKLDKAQMQGLYDVGMLEFLIATLDDKTVGYLGAAVSKNAYSDSTLGEIFIVYSVPELRGSGLGRDLIERFETKLSGNGPAACKLSMRKGHNEKFPLSLGYSIAEISYEKNITGGS